MASASQNPQRLFKQYLEVCNKALESNKDRFPYRQLWDAAQQLMDDQSIEVAIYDDHPKAAYNLKFRNHHIDAEQVLPQEEHHPWHLNLSYLEKVVAHPEEYINNPAKIDWDWLRNRTGL